MVELYAMNPTPHERVQWAMFGMDRTDEAPTGAVIFDDGPLGSKIVAARVRVRAGNEPQPRPVRAEPAPLPAGDKFLADVMRVGIGRLRPRLFLHDDYVSFMPVDWIGDPHAPFRILEWWAAGDGLVGRLWTALGAQDVVLPWVACVWCDDRKHQFVLRDWRLSFFTSPSAKASFIVRTFDSAREHSGVMQDASGIPVRGLLAFSDLDAMSSEQARTAQAAHAFPLVVQPERKHWGIWGDLAPTLTEAEFASELDRAHEWDWPTPYAWPGYAIANKDPGDTGEQPGFGCWSQAYAVACSSGPLGAPDVGRAAAMAHVAAAIAHREASRPRHWFEDDGKRVLLAKHPRLVTWGERPHYDRSRSRDQLGRDDQKQSGPGVVGRHPAHGWDGHDHQHDSATMLADDYLARGCPLTRHLIEHKAEMWVAGMSTWSEDEAQGRALGRSLLAFVRCCEALGDQRLFWRSEELLRNWIHHSERRGTMRRKIRDDRLFEGKFPVWVVWEDVLAIVGLDGWCRIALHFDSSEALRESIQRRVYDMAEDVVFEGHANRVLKYIQKWDDSSVYQLAGGGVRTWSRMALEVARRHPNHAVVQEARVILQTLGQIPLTMLRYDGVR